jgi:hypothetical protein
MGSRLDVNKRPVSHYSGENLMRRRWTSFSDLSDGTLIYDTPVPSDGEKWWKKVSARRAVDALGNRRSFDRSSYVYTDRKFASADYDRTYILTRLDQWIVEGANYLESLNKRCKTTESALQMFAYEARSPEFVFNMVRGQLAVHLRPLLTDERSADEQVAELRMVVLEMLAKRARAGVNERYDHSEGFAEREAYIKVLGILSDWLLSPYEAKS